MDMDYGHGHAQRRFGKILEILQLDLPTADPVFRCSHMMANRNCLDERWRESM